MDERSRCAWARTPLSIEYHDSEWGVPVHDDRTLFEFLTLEGAQAGLSWETILRKRDGYREAFVSFDPVRVARFTAARIARVLRNPGIVRNRLKVESTVRNARAFLAVQREFGTFDAYLWRFVGGRPRVNRWRTLQKVPARTRESDALSRDLLSRGFKFVGSTICYAFMQAVGMVNDHTIDCFRRWVHRRCAPAAAKRGRHATHNNGACTMSAIPRSDYSAASHATGRAQVLALLIGATLACAPVAAVAQRPAPATTRDTAASAQLEQMMGMFGQMGPMYETMMKSMIEGTLKALTQPENVERMAVFTRRYYEALIKQGFTKEEALHIVAGVGVPAMRMGR